MSVTADERNPHINAFIKFVPRLAPLFGGLEISPIVVDSEFFEYYLINSQLYRYFYSTRVSTDDKYKVFKDLVLIHYTLMEHKYLTKEEAFVLKVVNGAKLPVFEEHFEAIRNDQKASEEYIKRVFHFFVNTLKRMQQENNSSIDDLLGCTDCNGKKERDYWINFIIKTLTTVNQQTLSKIIKYLNPKMWEDDAEIDLKKLTLDQLRGVADIIRFD
ncbi:hypothetical protein EIN_056350 [Entamoeba invadens IP1]|uniref:hypothetical protein n=1 Tax=Entamoeba invadens IP1 TaxID=370355 RepID=UPI0002C3DF9D|nr:hypothetical protein EIN_056350 [Entamoeba invadens IP1]ELP93260.1 hypothetical protein EIN_056350 [Entamoeba invadens IP1]|eukprot:XP_004260031.1 hypothetical protein EIN_056350 [Entamoeba invadens IP1]